MNLLEHVRKTIGQHHLIQGGETIVLGISGGPDSLALAHLLRTLSTEWGVQIHLAHLNHQLRGAESDADAEFVAWLAREWNLRATIEARDVAAYAGEKKLSVEQAARQVRYSFLAAVAEKVGAHTIAVAHHADDQVETVLMHLLRGAGMAGLQGMKGKSKLPTPQLPMINYSIQIIRPLLDVPHAEIMIYCSENALHPRLDESNLDPTLFRNRLRREVLPYLETINPNLREVLLRTSRSLADDYDFLQSQTFAAFARLAHEENGAVVFDRAAWGALHPALQRGTLRIAIERLRQSLRDIAWTHIEDARLIALEKKIGSQAVLPHGLKLTIGYGEFVIGDATRDRVGFDLPQLSVECLALPNVGVVELPQSEWNVEIETHPALPWVRGGAARGWSEQFDQAKIRGEIILRRRKPGDTFQPAGMNGHSQSLHEFMIDQRIPRAARDCLPILCDSEKILWVCGHRLDERARVTDGTSQVMRVTLARKKSDGHD